MRFAYRPGDPPALDGVDLDVDHGEFVALAGANGSGKSTLARLLNGLLLPQEGAVRIDGLDTRAPESRWEVRRRVGLVFQNPDNQLVAAVVADDVAFGPENLGLPAAEIRRRVDEALAAVGLSDCADRAPHQLSGGQKQRVAIAGVLALRPDVLVLDEPTALLDPVGRAEVLSVLTRLRRESGTAVLLVTHRMEEAALADRLVVLAHGRAALSGAPREVFADARRLGALRLEEPPVHRLARLLRDAGLPVPVTPAVDQLADALCAARPSTPRGTGPDAPPAGDPGPSPRRGRADAAGPQGGASRP